MDNTQDTPEHLTSILQKCIDALDELLDSVPRTDPAYRRGLRALTSVCGKSGIIPTSCCLSDVVKPDDEYPHASGGFADVWRGTHDGVPVALKFIRLHTGNREGFRKMLSQEVVIWRRLLHCNIVPFLGVVDRRRPCIVSEWMEYEDVMSYLKRFPQANRTQLITDIARGLKYMHDSEVVHGDMKPRNVLVDSAHRARLSDFGLAVTAFATQSLAVSSSASSSAGTMRYLAPELTDERGEGKGLTKEADVYGFGMTSWEIFDGGIPFSNIRVDHAVLLKVQRGGRPSRPEIGPVDSVWALIEACWHDDPSARPSATHILTQLEVSIRVEPQLALPAKLHGHTGSVYSIAVSADGSRIASGSADQTIRIWSSYTGETTVGPLVGHTDQINSIAFSPHGRLLASGSDDHSVRIWDMETGLQVGLPLLGHLNSVRSVAFSHNDERIVSGSLDGTVRGWNVITGQSISKCSIGCGVLSVAFAPDGKYIISGSGDRKVRILDAETLGIVREPLEGHDSWVWAVAYSPDGKRIVSGSGDQTIRVWDAETGETVLGPLRGHAATVYSVAFSPDATGSRIVSGSQDGTIRIWDAHTGTTVVGPWRTHGGHWRVCSVAFMPDGKRVVSGKDDEVKVWDVEAIKAGI